MIYRKILLLLILIVCLSGCDKVIVDEETSTLTNESKKELAEKDENNQESAGKGEFIFSESNKNLLSDNDVNILSKELMFYARNEIFARHGYFFKNQSLKEYFEAKSWYAPNTEVKAYYSILNEIEIKNIELIKKYEDNFQYLAERAEFFDRENDIYEYLGSFDLNSDGIEEKLSFTIYNVNNTDTNRYTLQINDKKIEVDADNIAKGIQISDIDIHDQYKEITIFDDGPSGDPFYLFYRYDGKEIKNINGCWGYNLVFDSKGKLYTENCYLSFVEPILLYSWYEINDKGYLVDKKNDLAGKNVKITVNENEELNYWKLFPSDSSNEFSDDIVGKAYIGDYITIKETSKNRPKAIKVENQNNVEGWILPFIGD